MRSPEGRTVVLEHNGVWYVLRKVVGTKILVPLNINHYVEYMASGEIAEVFTSNKHADKNDNRLV